MHHRYALIIALFATGTSAAQLIVPNGNFDTFTACPNTSNRLHLVYPWFNAAALTPNYYNACDDGSVGVPNNSVGSQHAHSGAGYAGFFASQQDVDPDVREYVSCPLQLTLVAGQVYTLSFHVSLADYCEFGVATLGAYFSVGAELPMNNWLVNATPQVLHTGAAIVDTTNWTLISGSFTAAGGERYITIGNFQNDQNSGFQPAGGTVFGGAFYYIDDVVLEFSTAMQEHGTLADLRTYPGPFANELVFATQSTELLDIQLFDPAGRVVLQHRGPGPVVLNTSALGSGMYLYTVTANGARRQGRVVKE